MDTAQQVIVDVNVVLGWYFKTNQAAIDHYTLSYYQAVNVGRIIPVAPEVFTYEMAYALLKRGRANRINQIKIGEICEYIDMIVWRGQSDPKMNKIAGIARFALQHNVQGYDAHYLAAAKYSGLPIATLDKGLIAACKRQNVKIWQPGQAS